MNKFEAYQLSHPELLSEEALRDILKNSCIALPKFENLSKDEMVEIFKRIALPLPQRRYNEARPLGRALSRLRIKKGINTANYSDQNADIPSETTSRDDSDDGDGAKDRPAKERLKPSISDGQNASKRIRLSNGNSCRMETLGEKDAKRKSEDCSIPESKKRQKITWP